MEEAAALPLVAITAWESLFDRANIKSGQNVLIHGATGGVGHVAIQLAKWAGAKVFTTASQQNKMEIAHRLGADIAINYKEESVQEYVQKHTNGNGFEVIFDTVGGKNLDNSFEAAAVNGTVVTIAARSTHDLSPLHAKGLSLHVTFMALKILHTDKRDACGEILTKLTQIIEEGHLRPLLDSKTFTFDEVAQAHEYLESNKAIGKIVLKKVW